MDKQQAANKLTEVFNTVHTNVAHTESEADDLVALLMEIGNSEVITREQGKRVFELLAGMTTSEIVTVLSGFVTMDTGRLITLAKSAPNIKVKCVLYILATLKVLKWVVGLIKSRKASKTA